MKNDIDKIKELASRLQLIIQRLQYKISQDPDTAKSEAKELASLRAENEKTQNDLVLFAEAKKNDDSFRRLNFAISIVPAVIAAGLTVYVFSVSIKTSNDNQELYNAVRSRDSLIKILNKIIYNQDSILSVYKSNSQNLPKGEKDKIDTLHKIINQDVKRAGSTSITVETVHDKMIVPLAEDVKPPNH